MATQKDYIALGPSKQTTEKAVAPKPSIQELTTIERPGRPTPASDLEDSKSSKKQRAKRKTKKSTSEAKIDAPKKDSILIITEKPQSALKIASALGTPRKLTENNVAYYEITRDNKKIIVASAVGHLFNLTYSAGQKGWPIFNLEWQPSYLKKNSAFTKRYFDLLKKLSKRANEYIVATDFDIEGEVIGWNVLRFICNQKTAKRMKYSTLTAPELLDSYEKPMKELEWGNAYAGESRHFLDWLYGINLSRALMSAIKQTGSFKILSIGRVQGPTLKIIVDRDKEIDNFKPVPYWQIFAHSNKTKYKHPTDIFEKKELEKFKEIKEANAETKNTEESLQPLNPFDLTTLQREAYRLFKMSPSETLKIAQQLYLDGLISYPRTSSQKVPDSIKPKEILKRLQKRFPEAIEAERPNPIEGNKSDPAHPSIHPTGEFSNMKERDEKLYNIIAKRFIALFSNDALTANRRTTLTALPLKKEKITFTASGIKIINLGWTKFYPYKIEESEIPNINGKVKIDKIEIEEKETNPPNRYTPTSLVSILEKKNLGTKATRSMIVDTLFDRGYLDGKSIQATPLGKRLIETLEKHSPIIIDEELTRQLEQEMEKIQESNSNFLEQEKQILDKAKRLITDISKEFKSKEKEIGQDLLKGLENLRQAQTEANTLTPCKTCNKGSLRILYSKKTKRYFIACSNYPNCTQTYSVPPNSLIKKAETDCPADLFPKLLAIRKGKRPWEFCFNPECPIEKEKREKWQAQKEARDSKNTVE
ncbi:DNA topoisomerase I [Candidatus Pacearchaeota archaeon CG10_big_fil_rev_8_21_14_0_10_31_24]|nr:MAG: DNA topoisomerase I [Candidatus Pacearchaeota archaeon CG10_big_fil_rev_8_21_14_0_10_31_24]